MRRDRDGGFMDTMGCYHDMPNLFWDAYDESIEIPVPDDYEHGSGRPWIRRCDWVFSCARDMVEANVGSGHNTHALLSHMASDLPPGRIRYRLKSLVDVYRRGQSKFMEGE